MLANPAIQAFLMFLVSTALSVGDVHSHVLAWACWCLTGMLLLVTIFRWLRWPGSYGRRLDSLWYLRWGGRVSLRKAAEIIYSEARAQDSVWAHAAERLSLDKSPDGILCYIAEIIKQDDYQESQKYVVSLVTHEPIPLYVKNHNMKGISGAQLARMKTGLVSAAVALLQIIKALPATTRALVRQGLTAVGQLWLPLSAVALCLAVLYLPEQSVALCRSLSAVLSESGQNNLGSTGFTATFGEVVAWLGASGTVVVVCWFYVPRAVSAQSRFRGETAFGAFVQLVILALGAHLLILAPLFLHPWYNLWTLETHLSLLVISYTLLRYSLAGHWLKLIAAAITYVVVVTCVGYGAPQVAVAIAVLVPFSYLVKSHDSSAVGWRHRWRLKEPTLLLVATISALFGSIWLDALLEPYPFQEYRKTWHPLMLGLWWVFPALITSLALRIRLPRPRTAAKVLVALATVEIALHGGFRSDASALTTLCLSITLALVALFALRHPRAKMLRTALVSVLAFSLLWSAFRLNPSIDLEHANVQPSPTSSGDDESFKEFYDAWLAARGESESDKGPIILVAGAGGGIRAAEHTALSLAAADDYTNGAFGTRVFAVSGVSGGSLGILSWLAARDSRLLPATQSVCANPMYLRGTWRLGDFYAHDFISPAATRMLSSDVPLAMLPWPAGKSSRDKALASSWNTGWDEVAKDYGLDTDRSLFERQVQSLSSDAAHFPMTVLNATAAADGRRAVYTSVSTDFPGAWALDPTAQLGTATLDSARFALVSPVGSACARFDTTSSNDKVATTEHCPAGYRSLAVADGGYADNSGLASVSDILDKLQKLRPNLENVYVVSITSNPTQNVAFKEGTRFDNGRLLAELAAPAYVMENSRAGHTTVFSDLVAKRIGESHFLRWEMVSAKSVEYWRGQYLKATASSGNGLGGKIAQMHSRSHAIEELDLAPLGWTLDPFSAGAVFSQAVSHFRIWDFPVCTQYAIGADGLCNALAPYAKWGFGASAAENAGASAGAETTRVGAVRKEAVQDVSSAG